MGCGIDDASTCTCCVGQHIEAQCRTRPSTHDPRTHSTERPRAPSGTAARLDHDHAPCALHGLNTLAYLASLGVGSERSGHAPHHARNRVGGLCMPRCAHAREERNARHSLHALAARNAHVHIRKSKVRARCTDSTRRSQPFTSPIILVPSCRLARITAASAQFGSQMYNFGPPWLRHALMAAASC